MNLTIGANTVKEIQLRDSAGNDVILADLQSVSVQIRQWNRLIVNYDYPHAQLQPGSTNSKLKIEITKAVSLSLNEGNVYARVIEDNDDAAFVVDTQARYLPDYLLFYAVLTDTEYQSDSSVSSPDTDHWRGEWDGTTTLPTTGGTETGGAPGAGDEWVLTDTLVIGGNVYAAGTIIKALVNSPGQTLTNWAFLANQL